MLLNGTFTLSRVNEIFKSEKIEISGEGEAIAQKYTLGDVACTLSHLKAIQQAYQDGLESILIVENNAVLSVDFLEKWKMYADLAPLDWNILQWTTNNPVVNKERAYQSNDFWISWSGHHWSSLAYTIGREGMRRILKRTSNFFTLKNKDQMEWKLDEPNILMSDEVIYLSGGNTYTSTHSWIKDARIDVAYPDSKKSKDVITNYDRRFFERPEHVAVIQNLRMRSVNEVHVEILALDSDVGVLARSNPRSKWFVNVVLTKFDLLCIFQNDVLL